MPVIERTLASSRTFSVVFLELFLDRFFERLKLVFWNFSILDGTSNLLVSLSPPPRRAVAKICRSCRNLRQPFLPKGSLHEFGFHAPITGDLDAMIDQIFDEHPH